MSHHNNDPQIVTNPAHAPTDPPVPPPASATTPQPPTNTGGAADARNQVQTSVRNKKEPRQFSTPSAAQVTSAPPLILGVSNLPFYTNQKLETNTFLPCFITLFAILSTLDANMSNTYRFLQSAPNWIPLVSQAYISVIAIVHVFRIAREANTITAEQFQFLQWFESVYDFRTLMVPGPLVPVLQSMAYTSGPFDWMGNISPALFDAFRPVRRDSYSCAQNGQVNIPSIPLIIDQIQWFLTTFNITTANEHFITDNFYSNLFNTPAALGSFGMYAMLNPASRFLVSVSAQQYKNFKSQAGSFQFPPRLAATTANTYMSWFEFFRFKPIGAVADTYQWFSTMSSTMQRYCQFVRGSVPMSSIALTGLGASSPIWYYQPTTQFGIPPSIVDEQSFTDPNNNVQVQFATHFRTPAPVTLSTVGKHFDPELEELAEQYSAASQINVSFSELSADEQAQLPSDVNSRRGEVWSLPMIRESPDINVLPTHGPLIMTHYHSDTRAT